jgi:hypothetical protein
MIQHVIASYRVIHRHVRHGVWAEIHLYNAANKMIGSLYFMDDDEDLRPAKSDPRIMIWWPDRRLAATMDLLRSGSGVVLVYKAPNEAFLTDTSRLNTPANDADAHVTEEECSVWDCPP